MAEIVTVKERWDADEVFRAVERAHAYSDGLDELEAYRHGWPEPRPSVMTRILQDAWSLIQEVKAAEREEEWEASYTEVCRQEFATRFGLKTNAEDDV